MVTDAFMTNLGRCRAFLGKFLPLDLSPRLSSIQATDVDGGLLNLLA